MTLNNLVGISLEKISVDLKAIKRLITDKFDYLERSEEFGRWVFSTQRGSINRFCIIV